MAKNRIILQNALGNRSIIHDLTQGIYRLDPPTSEHRRYTVYVTWPDGGSEEIDVDARDESQAKLLAKAALGKDYQKGGSITSAQKRTGLYL